MKIIGIDPGYGRVGYGIIEGERTDWHAITYGCIETNSSAVLADRLLEIQTALNALLRTYAPDAAAVEKLFFAKNQTTAMGVAQARGAILLTLQGHGLASSEYTPLQVKQAMTGYGKATKEQVQQMVCHMVCLPKKRIQDDAADALAVALTHGVSVRMQSFF